MKKYIIPTLLGTLTAVALLGASGKPPVDPPVKVAKHILGMSWQAGDQLPTLSYAKDNLLINVSLDELDLATLKITTGITDATVNAALLGKLNQALAELKQQVKSTQEGQYAQ